jgi:hypothetical protein
VALFSCLLNIDGFLKSSLIVMPDLIRHPEHIEIAGFTGETGK